jgi:hypothetical protein
MVELEFSSATVPLPEDKVSQLEFEVAVQLSGAVPELTMVKVAVCTPPPATAGMAKVRMGASRIAPGGVPA